jgi:hypothetical protein
MEILREYKMNPHSCNYNSNSWVAYFSVFPDRILCEFFPCIIIISGGKGDNPMKWLIESKKHRIEIVADSVEDLINELEEDEVPCTVTNQYTKNRFKLTRRIVMGVKKDGSKFFMALPGLRRCSFE